MGMEMKENKRKTNAYTDIFKLRIYKFIGDIFIHIYIKKQHLMEIANKIYLSNYFKNVKKSF